MGEVRFMISEAAKQVQVESHVLRYWEEELGLEIGRTDMGHRYYTKDDIQLFLCIQKLKNEGMLLRDLKPLIPELTKTRKKLNAEKQALSDIQTADSPAPSSESDKPVESASAIQAEASDLTLPETAFSRAALSDTAPPETEVIPVTQLEQVRSLIGDVLSDVVAANNETLKKDISRKVTSDVIREMDFLFQANERREEEHYRKLDCLIRQQQASRREAARETPIGKLRKLLT